MKTSRILKITLLLAAAFTFALLLGELVHDSGHYFCHLAYGNTWIKVQFDPFGGTHIMGAGELPADILGVTSLVGPLSNLILGVLCSTTLWRFRKPILLPLLLWGPVSMIQEGVTCTLGFLTPGGDAFWISKLGIPAALIVLFGMIIFICGIISVALLLPLAGFQDDEPFLRKFIILFFGMGSLMIVRFVYSAFISPQYLVENLAPLVLSVVLMIIIVIIHPKINHLIMKKDLKQPTSLPWYVLLVSSILGAGMFFLQMVL
jgi:hypothetical protein